ncbi:MAG: hypothetical protein RMK74_01825 [Myxococcales bacterium]|nr:hypothetical protein [Myxococcales bacterium]
MRTPDRRLATLVLWGSVLATTSCKGRDAGRRFEDAGHDVGATDAGVDAGHDAGLPPSTIFGPCLDDSQCPGEGAFCRKPQDGYPQGQCTVPCAAPDRTPCDDGITYHHCLRRPEGDFCEYRCLNGLDCGRRGYTCAGVDEVAAGSGFCIGVCASDDECGGGAQCNVWSGRCMAAGTVPTEGGRHGEPCRGDADCLSQLCIEQRAMAPRWLGGYCVGPCILPAGYNTNTLFAGERLPRATCPEGNVCFVNGTFAEGDLGVCLRECAVDEDCRSSDGYVCVRSFRLPGGTARYENGVCVPIGLFG